MSNQFEVQIDDFSSPKWNKKIDVLNSIFQDYIENYYYSAEVFLLLTFMKSQSHPIIEIRIFAIRNTQPFSVYFRVKISYLINFRPKERLKGATGKLQGQAQKT